MNVRIPMSLASFEKISPMPYENTSYVLCAIEKIQLELYAIVSNFPFPLCHSAVSTVSCRELLLRVLGVRKNRMKSPNTVVQNSDYTNHERGQGIAKSLCLPQKL
jgi:hypothetical protein